VADPITGEQEETRTTPPDVHAGETALQLLRRRDFRRLYLAVTISELGWAYHYIALMWIALVTAGPLGVVAVRLADSLPALVFGFHGGLVADRHERRRTMIGADAFRAVVLVPVAIAGLSGSLPLWGLVATAFLLEAATSYFAPAYGALVPVLAGRRNVQAANGLVHATIEATAIGGWAVAAALLAVLPISAFFALNAASFLISAVLLAGIGREAAGAPEQSEHPRVREGFAALAPHRMLAAAVMVLGVAVTLSAGTWIAGVPQLVREGLGRGAGSFSLIMSAYALGSICAGVFLARRPVRRKAAASMLAWSLYLPGYLLLGFAASLPVAMAGAVAAALGQSSAIVLVNSAAQEQIADNVLGRVMGLISLVHRGAHASGLLLVSPLFAFVAPRAVFVAAAIALPTVGILGTLVGARWRPARTS
jgi:MFS transporter, DHA3 family, macrolide efflux protein